MASPGLKRARRRKAAEHGMTEIELRELRKRRTRIFRIAYGQKAHDKRPHEQALAELQSIAQASAVEVKVLPPGTHAGWMPSWRR